MANQKKNTAVKPDNTAQIFRELRKIMMKFAPPLLLTKNSDSGIELISRKQIAFMGRKFDEMFFGSAVIRPKYVVFYFMPVYTGPQLLNEIPERLRKCMKGKSCFHFTTWDDELRIMVDDMAEAGFDYFKKIDFI